MKAAVLLTAILVAFIAWPGVAGAATEEEIQAAIDDGLVWLAGKQNTTVGDPNYGSWGVSRRVAKTGLAVKKFEHDAMLREEYESPFDPTYPYREHVIRGLDYIFAHSELVDITGHVADTDTNGIAVSFGGGLTYETGIALMAIAESMDPDRVVDVDGSVIDGWTYGAVAVDVMNWLAYAQAPIGGWGYNAADDSPDQSNSGYATLGLGFFAAPSPNGFGLNLPSFVTDQYGDPGNWVDIIQNDVNGDAFDGGSGYSNANNCVNTLETGNLLFEMALYGDPPQTQRVQDAIDYLVRAWNLAGVPIGGNWCSYQGWLGNYQAMFTVMKGLEAYQIDLIDSIDWFEDLSTYIVNNQNGNGSWGPDFWDNYAGADTILSTSWALLTLQKAAPPIILDVEFDMKPTSCPNPLNPKSKGVLPAAILGTEDFDVATVAPLSLELEGVAPLRWAYEDVAAPVGDDPDTCECTTEGPDGYMDMTLKFENQAIVAALGDVSNGDVIPLTLTGMTTDSLAFETQDCIIVRARGKAYEVAGGEATARPSERPEGAITEISLARAHPNPFSSETRVLLSLPERTDVLLIVSDVSGRMVRTLIDRSMAAGRHAAHWDGSDEAGIRVASGVYFCRLRADGRELVTKLILIE